eukprot:11846810-Alexandrium_andersonii.AAC.1
MSSACKAKAVSMRPGAPRELQCLSAPARAKYAGPECAHASSRGTGVALRAWAKVTDGARARGQRHLARAGVAQRAWAELEC